MPSVTSEMEEPDGLATGETATLAGALTETGHLLEARVYYADTDLSGSVYHARYLEFLERGRIEYLRLVGAHRANLTDRKQGDGVVWIIRRLEIEYRQPARLDDTLTIETKTADISGARVFVAQTIRRSGKILVNAQIECALIDQYGRPQRFPKEWRRLFRPQNM